MKEKPKTPWLFIIILIIVLIFISWIIAGIISFFVGTKSLPISGNVAVIPIKGIITTEPIKSMISFSTSSSDMIELIEKAAEDKNVKAVVFEINSPGGSAVATDEIARAVKRLNKTKVAWIRELGASGGYWIASATDYIIANRMAITGSIGVTSSYLQISGFLSEHNVTYERLVSGEYKDLGSPFKDLTTDERLLLEKKLDKIHDYFVEEVAKNRNLPRSKVKGMASGEFYLGSEAKDLGLVDALGDKETVKVYLERKLNITVEFSTLKKEKRFFDILSEVLSKNSFFVGEGIGSSIFSKGDELKIVT